MSHSISYSTFTPSANDQEAPVQAGPSVNYNTGGFSATSGSGTVSTQSQTTQQVSTTELSNFAAGDWRSTARTPQGLPTNNITAATVVEIGGMTAPIATFMRAGVLAQQGNEFVMTGDLFAQHEQTKTEEADPDAANMTAAQQQAMNAAIEPLSQGTFDSCIANGAAVAAGEMNFDTIVSKISSESGMDPSQAAQCAAVARETYQLEADRFVMKAGIHADDLPEFYEWCRATANKSALKQAVQGQLYMRSLSGYRALIDGYLAATPPSVEALNANGMRTRVINGVDEVQVRGRWLPITSAARSGLI